MPGSDTPHLYQTVTNPSQAGWNQLNDRYRSFYRTVLRQREIALPREGEEMTASADHVKALIRAHATGDESSFYSVALQMGP